MSITFHLDPPTPIGWQIQCICGNAIDSVARQEGEELGPLYERAGMLYQATKLTTTYTECCDDQYHGELVLSPDFGPEYVSEYDVNVSNKNGRNILIRLGLFSGDEYGELAGSADPDAFAAAVLGMNVADDDGVESRQEGRVFYGGIRPGYFWDIQSRLLRLAMAAREEDSKVIWG